MILLERTNWQECRTAVIGAVIKRLGAL